MLALYKKELKAFLGSLTGYLAIVVFLLLSGLFLWIFPGGYNIIENGQSTLEGFFNIAPWLYLLLVPAVTMRLFAEEKRLGTLEVLLTRPVSDFAVIISKFLAALTLVILSLLPTIVYFISVYFMGNPVGNLDVGATTGSIFGLFFLAAIYVSIGLFASSVSDNQITSFILAVLLSFVFYLGFDFIARSGLPYFFELLFTWISISNHYLSASRGLVDMRDMVYFTGMIAVFLYSSRFFIRKRKWLQRNQIIKNMVFYGAVVLVFFVTSFFLWRIDLTADKRFTLSEVSKQICSGLNQDVEIELFLTGELEPGLRRLQQEILEKTAVLDVYSPSSIKIIQRDPYSITNTEKRNQFFNEIIQKGVKPTNLNVKTDKGTSQKTIFPGALIRYNDKETAVNFLSYNPGFNNYTNLKHSYEGVEFEMVNALRKLQKTEKSTLAFLSGNDELAPVEVTDFANTLSGEFNIIKINPENLENSKPGIVVIAKPVKPFTETDKLRIDQYLMRGGKIMWLIDPVSVSADSLSKGMATYAFPLDLNLGDMLFKYGLRLNYELLQDVECSQIKVNTAPVGQPPNFTLHPWYYNPILVPSDDNPVSKNLNGVKSEFVSSIDTLAGSEKVRKHVVLTTSPYSRRVKSPSSVSLRNIENPPARELFNEKFITTGVILEGNFVSVFKNRMVENLGYSTSEILPESKTTKMAVFSDGDLIANPVSYVTSPPKIAPMGYDRPTGITYGNKEFMVNMINYLDDTDGIMQLRNRSLKMRPLDIVRLREERKYWQWINLTLPSLMVIVFGVIFNALRKRKYGSP